MKHSKIGASTCERWWNCPGSVALVASVPQQPQSPFAQEGTNAHALAEHCLRTNSDAIEWIGCVIPNHEFEVTQEMADAVQVYLDTIRNDMAQYDVHPSDLKIEHKFHLAHIDKDAFGTNDANLPVFLTRLIVYDYKHGQGVAVDAEENKQGLYYALGAVQGEEFDEVEIVIVQPRAIHRDGPVRRWVITREDLQKFENELRVKVAAAKQKDAKVVAGNWCKKTFCPAMAVCPAVRKEVELCAMVVFDEDKEELPLMPPDKMSPLTLRRLLNAMPLIDEWLKSVWSYAETKANNGEDILGYKLVRGREGHRKWKDEVAVANAVITKIDPAFDPYEKVLMSPAKLEKALGKKKANELAPFITRSEGRVMLVPEDDPREEVKPNLLSVFDEVENDNLFT